MAKSFSGDRMIEVLEEVYDALLRETEREPGESFFQINLHGLAEVHDVKLIAYSPGHCPLIPKDERI